MLKRQSPSESSVTQNGAEMAELKTIHKTLYIGHRGDRGQTMIYSARFLKSYRVVWSRSCREAEVWLHPGGSGPILLSAYRDGKLEDWSADSVFGEIVLFPPCKVELRTNGGTSARCQIVLNVEMIDLPSALPVEIIDLTNEP